MSITRDTRSHRVRKEQPRESQKYRGLCITCIHASECINATQAKLPVVYCEEFEDRPVSQMGLVESPFSIRSGAKKESGGPPSIEPELKGLCVNCDNRKICKIPRPAGGVCHCEEYR